MALLRNLVTSLIETESIRTTWPRAKEAQRMAEKLITLGKRNTEAARQQAQAILFVRLYYLCLTLPTNTSAPPPSSSSFSFSSSS
jgi:ribosomal protein L17